MNGMIFYGGFEDLRYQLMFGVFVRRQAAEPLRAGTTFRVRYLPQQFARYVCMTTCDVGV